MQHLYNKIAVMCATHIGVCSDRSPGAEIEQPPEIVGYTFYHMWSKLANCQRKKPPKEIAKQNMRPLGMYQTNEASYEYGLLVWVPTMKHSTYSDHLGLSRRRELSSAFPPSVPPIAPVRSLIPLSLIGVP